jgi:hypothetical protein
MLRLDRLDSLSVLKVGKPWERLLVANVIGVWRSLDRLTGWLHNR